MQRGFRHKWPRLARAVTALALLAMLVRVAIPPGYMLGPAEAGRFITVTLCSGQGPATTLMDLRTGEIVEADGAGDPAPVQNTHKDAPCVFAAAAPLSPPEAAPALAVAFKAAAAAPFRAFAQIPGRGLAAPPPWSTGPPLAV